MVGVCGGQALLRKNFITFHDRPNQPVSLFNVFKRLFIAEQVDPSSSSRSGSSLLLSLCIRPSLSPPACLCDVRQPRLTTSSCLLACLLVLWVVPSPPTLGVCGLDHRPLWQRFHVPAGKVRLP